MLVPYEGGPVVYCPLVYTSFWGPSWKAENAALASQLNQFIQDLLAATPWMNILTQYGVTGTGAFVQATYLPNLSTTLTVASYENIFEAMIAFGLIPAPTQPPSPGQYTSPQVFMVFLDPNVVINDPVTGRQLNVPGAQDAGYHDSFTLPSGRSFIYAFTEFTDLNFITTIMSHEFAEMITDPLYTAWTPDHAQHEIGDYCEGADTTITVSGRTWTVQEIWSDQVNSCVASSATKIPPISPGPGGMAVEGGATIDRRGRGPAKAPDLAAVDAADLLPHHRVLPLPPVSFNHLTGEKRIDDADIRAYAHKLFSPLRHEHLFDDFPAFLHQAAAVLEGQVAATDGAAPDIAGHGATGGEVVETAPSEVLVGAAPMRRQGVAAKRRADGK